MPTQLYEGEYIRLIRKYNWEYAERVNSSGSVGIIAVTDDDEIILVEQYRIPIEKRCIEVPAGLVGDIDNTETLEQAAERELLEETGYSAKFMEKSISFPLSPGMSNEMSTLFRATGLIQHTKGGGDEDEDIIVHKIRLEQLENWIKIKIKKGYIIGPRVYMIPLFT